MINLPSQVAFVLIVITSLIPSDICFSGHGDEMVVATQAQQQLMEAGVVGRVGVESGTGVEMMVMDSLDPNLLQMKTEVSLL